MMAPRFCAVQIVLFAVAAVVITECRGTRSRGQGGRTEVNCSTYKCKVYENRTQDGCPTHCRCSGTDRTTEFPKPGFCVVNDGGFRHPDANSSSLPTGNRGGNGRH
uniref:Evasin n=1 Tax=Rhipicephalus zambeziensis TaxID=60191 RepID=A0A224YE45_9ACAR